MTTPRKIKGKITDLRLNVVSVEGKKAYASTKYGYALWVKGFTLTEWNCSHCGAFIKRGYDVRAWRLSDPKTTEEAGLRLCVNCVHEPPQPVS